MGFSLEEPPRGSVMVTVASPPARSLQDMPVLSSVIPSAITGEKNGVQTTWIPDNFLSLCSCWEWLNPHYCFLLHLNFHLPTFPFFQQFLKYFLTFLPGKKRHPTMPFLFSLGKGHSSPTYFSIYIELSKKEKYVVFTHPKEKDLHIAALAQTGLTPTMLMPV